jgi:hypothetical protein
VVPVATTCNWETPGTSVGGSFITFGSCTGMGPDSSFETGGSCSTSGSTNSFNVRESCLCAGPGLTNCDITVQPHTQSCVCS